MNNIKNFGLQPLKRDRRDYSHAKTFGVVAPVDLPQEYLLVSTILDQGVSFHCTAYSSCAVQESQHGVQFNPEWFYEQEGVVNGAVSETGYDLRVAMSTGTKVGFMPAAGGTPDYYKEASYFSLVPSLFSSQDLFDSIRSAMWLAKDEKKCAELGTMWYDGWVNNAIIDNTVDKSSPIGLHAIKCAGWTEINGIPYLVIQNSWGADHGKNGLYYFSREVVNKEFRQGAYMWRTPQDATPQQIATVGVILTLIQKILDLLFSPAPVPPVQPQPPQPMPAPEAPHPNIQVWALAIQGQEGGKPGDRNMRNNNPGNMKFAPLTQSLGATSKDPDNFCVFPTYEAGFKALCDFLTMACKNELKPYHDQTILGFTNIYAQPPNDLYARAVAKALKVDVNTKISTLI